MRLPLNATSRVIATHLLLVALSTGLILGFVWLQTKGEIDSQVRERVRSELETLATEYDRRGLVGLARAVDERMRQPGAADTVYLLSDPDGTRLAGNLGGWPPTVKSDTGWTRLELYRTDRQRPSPILAVAVTLPGGQRLLVGHDSGARQAFDRTLGQALIWGLAGTVGLALLTGWLLSRLVLRRIDDVARTAREFRAGDLAQRVPLRGTGDEFDRLAGELNHMLTRIEALVTDLRMVTDGLAHDLRSPLTRLQARLEEARQANAGNAEAEAAIDRAAAEGRRVLGVFTALLDIARAEAGVGREQFAPLDLATLARDAAELFAPAAEETGRSLTLESPGPVAVEGHGQLLAQALTNLVENALGHAPEGSAIRIEAARQGDEAVLAVTDRGPGIRPEDRERVQARFVRLDAARAGGGAGLGLALVQAIARLHEGRLVLGDNGPGLRAELRLPAAQGRAMLPGASAPAAAG